MQRRLLAMTLLAAVLLPAQLFAEAKIEQIVVLPFIVSGGLDAKKGALLDELFLTELSQTVPAGVKVIGSSDVTAMLGQVEQQQLAGCDDTGCLVEIGQALGASHVIVSSLGKLGDRFVVNTKLISVADAAVLFRKALYLGETEGELLDAVRTVSQELAVSRGWGTAAAAAPSATADGGAGDLLLWTGVGLAGAGLLTMVGCGIGAVAFDAQAGDQEKDWADRQTAGWIGLGMLGGTALGLVVAGGGAALALLSMGEE